MNPFGPLSAGLLQALPPNQSRQVSDGGNIQVLANGPLVKLPAGPLYVSAKLGDAEASVSSSSDIRGFTLAQTLARNDMQGQLNFDLPIASRRRHVLGALGELSLNANTAVDDYSDFGPLLTLGYGVNWTPIPGYSLIVSETHDHLAPTIAQLEGPIVTTPGVRVFDFATGQTATVTQITGGNPALQADDRQVMKIGLTLKPWPKQDLTFTANYVDSHIANWIGALPAATAAIQAAFPDRFIRNADGDLVAEDDRTLNFASQDRTELRWGINFSMPVGKQPPPPPAYRGQFRRRGGGSGGDGGGGRPGGRFAGPPGGAPGDDEGGAPGAGPGGPDGQSGGPGGPGPGGGPVGGGYGGYGGRGGGFGGGGVWRRPGRSRRRGLWWPAGGRPLPVRPLPHDHLLGPLPGRARRPGLDLLGGAPVGNAGGQYQHEVEAQMGYVNEGYGARLSADWRSATTVTGGAGGGTGTLDFSDVATVNLRLWDDFSQQRALITRYPALRGVRLTLNVTNLFNQSIQVRDWRGRRPSTTSRPSSTRPAG